MLTILIVLGRIHSFTLGNSRSMLTSSINGVRFALKYPIFMGSIKHSAQTSFNRVSSHANPYVKASVSSELHEPCASKQQISHVR